MCVAAHEEFKDDWIQKGLRLFIGWRERFTGKGAFAGQAEIASNFRLRVFDRVEVLFLK